MRARVGRRKTARQTLTVADPLSEHHALVRDEFRRQAEAMASAPAFSSEDVIARFRGALAPGTGRLLDLACGPGILSEALAPHAALIVGLDLTGAMTATARARCGSARVSNAAFLQAPAEALPLAARSFDAIVTRLSIHHFPDPARVLREIRRVLKPKGRLVLADLISVADPAEARLHNALEKLRDPSHVRILPEAGLRKLISDSGFRVLRTKRWRQKRRFDEWGAIVANARPTESLAIVMASLARAGVTAGMDLRVAGDSVEFVHRWLLVVAEPA